MALQSRKHIKRGIFWLGSANLATRLIDVASIVVILWFLTKEQMGLATLAWTVAVVLEAFNGLGIGTALLQADTVSRKQQDTSWWFTMGIAGSLFLCIWGASSFIADYYDAPSLRSMIIVSGSKLLFVGAALLPIQMINRKLGFKEIGIVSTIATLLSSLLKIGLAATGFGAWALVIGTVAHGFFMAVGAYSFYPFFPRLHFVFSEIKEMVIFGSKVTASSVVFHFYRNADYLVVGRFLGKEALGVYRVAFDIAMTPALTLLGVVNRTAFPIFSRMKNNREELANTFNWIQKNFAFIVTPIALFLTFASFDLMHLIGKAQWIEAAGAIKILAWAALLRCLAQVFPQVFHACGKPEYAIYDSLLSLLMLVGTFSTAIFFFGQEYGILSVSYAWLLSYPILILFLWIFARLLIPLNVGQYLTGFVHSIGVGLIAGIACYALAYWKYLLPAGHLLPVLLFGAIIGTIVWGYLKLVLKTSIRGIFKYDPDKKEVTDEE